MSARPDFVDLADDDLRPSPSSVVVDHGLLIPGIDDDFSGTAPDLGAFELGAVAVDAGIPSLDASSANDASAAMDGARADGGVAADASHGDVTMSADGAVGSEPATAHSGCGCRIAGRARGAGRGGGGGVIPVIALAALRLARRRRVRR